MDKNLTTVDLLGIIPEARMSSLSEHVGVDYYTKDFHGKKMFYLLMYVSWKAIGFVVALYSKIK